MRLMTSGNYRWMIGLIATVTILSGCQENVADRAPQPGIEVMTDKGLVRGIVKGESRVFLGMPYAAPPVGERRWRPPSPTVKWTGVRDAQNRGATCTQGEGGRGGIGSEDCLVINVWAPRKASLQPLPVFVWIHGGGFVVGSSNIPMLDGQHLSEAGNIVVVSFNYRLGLLGFLALAELSAESPSNSSGAYGFFDQLAALQWVKRNIASFGGDPSEVTLGGNSAGAMSVCNHLASAASRGLFQRAIIHSGSCMPPTPALEDYEKQGNQVVAKVGCDGDADVLACMRRQDAQRVMDAFEVENPSPGGVLFQQAGIVWEIPPTVDKAFLDQPVEQSFAAGDVAKVPVIIGANENEGGLLVYGQPAPDGAKGYNAALNRRYGSRAQDVLRQYPLEDFDSPVEALAKIVSDELFLCPTKRTAEYLRQAGLDVFLYKFEQPLEKLGDPWTTAFHTSEIPFVFGNAHFFTELGQADLDYSAKVMPYWLRFITTGDPNSEGVTPWPDYKSDSHLVFGEPIRAGNDFGNEKCEFWKQ